MASDSSSRQPVSCLESYRGQIAAWVEEGVPHNEIKARLKETIQFNDRTYWRRIKTWGLQKNCRIRNSHGDPDYERIKGLVMMLYFKPGLEDSEILKVLRAKNVQTSKRTVQRIRKDMNLLRLIRGEENKALADEFVRRQLMKESATGALEVLGRQRLKEYFTYHGHPVSRDRLFDALREVRPEAIESRQLRPHRTKGHTVAAAWPDEQWCIDAHCKKEEYGIEVYAAIDSYSRYIPWIYTGISARTAFSALRGYLDTVDHLQRVPRTVRSDRGGETVLVAAAQWLFRQQEEPEVPFRQTYKYGTSKANQRIESWWNQLRTGLTRKYTNYFRKLTLRDEFERNQLEDQIALLAVYLPVIRAQAIEFADRWNMHKLTKKQGEPHIVGGRPWMLYNMPEPPVSSDGFPVNQDLLGQLRSSLPSWDKDEFLPPETLDWCLAKLRAIDHDPFHPPLIPDGEKDVPYRDAYRHLRAELRIHTARGNIGPTLALLEKPLGGADSLRSQLVTRMPRRR